MKKTPKHTHTHTHTHTHMEISSFYTSKPKIMIICYTVPEIWSVTDIVIFHMCTENYDHTMYGSWDMVHDWRKRWHIEVGVPPKKILPDENTNFN